MDYDGELGGCLTNSGIALCMCRQSVACRPIICRIRTCDTGPAGQAKGDGRERLKDQASLQRELNEKYNAEIAEKHGLNAEQLKAISVEGLENHWPMPNLPPISGPAAERPKVKHQLIPKPALQQPKTQTPEEQANARLAMARNYLQFSRRDRAREILQSIIKDYPDTLSAKEAKKELEQLE